MYKNMIFLAHILTSKSDNLMSTIILLLEPYFQFTQRNIYYESQKVICIDCVALELCVHSFRTYSGRYQTVEAVIEQFN